MPISYEIGIFAFYDQTVPSINTHFFKSNKFNQMRNAFFDQEFSSEGLVRHHNILGVGWIAERRAFVKYTVT